MNVKKWIWVFNGANGSFPGGVFETRNAAEAWISKHGLEGTLTLYPVDVGVYDWAVAEGHFTPKKDHERSKHFIGSFTSACMEHYHYEDDKSMDD